jgi:hypothetical protein
VCSSDLGSPSAILYHIFFSFLFKKCLHNNFYYCIFTNVIIYLVQHVPELLSILHQRERFSIPDHSLGST